MSPDKHRRRNQKINTGRGVGPRDLVEAFRRYYDRVERDQSGNLAVTCTRCRVTEVIVWETDERYVLGCLQHGHQHHNHAGR